MRGIIGRAVSSTKPKYNTYVKSLTRDLTPWLRANIQLLEFCLIRIEELENQIDELRDQLDA